MLNKYHAVIKQENNPAIGLFINRELECAILNRPYAIFVP